MGAADRLADDIVAYIKTLTPAEAVHELAHIQHAAVGMLTDVLTNGEDFPDLTAKQLAAATLMLVGAAQGALEQIATKPEGVRPAVCLKDVKPVAVLLLERCIAVMAAHRQG